MAIQEPLLVVSQPTKPSLLPARVLCLFTFMPKEILAKIKFNSFLARFEYTTIQSQIEQVHNQFMFHDNSYNFRIVHLLK